MIPDVRYALNDGVNIAYQVWGEGDRDLLIVWGLIAHLDIMAADPDARRWFERLGAFARVITFDRRGTGLSDPVAVTSAPDHDARMSDITAVLDAVGSERAVLLSQSEGGQLAILFAATHPERTEALVLSGATARSTYADDHPWAPTREALAESATELLAPAWGSGVMIDISAPSRSYDEATKARYGILERSISPGMLASVVEMFHDTDVRSVLPSVRVPTLVLHRRGDRLANIRNGRYLAEHIPDATLIEIPGTDHLPFFERPEEWAAAIEKFITGTTKRAPVNRRLSTVLFSDIVASTERAATLGDKRWRELLGRHDEIVREELAHWGGVAVKSLGDGFLATFDGPTAAISGARAIRNATAAIQLDVRIGMHTGEIEIIGDDIAGIAVHIAARIGALAGAGEILASRTVRDLVAGSAVSFEPRGSHTLKGVPDDWEIVAVAD